MKTPNLAAVIAAWLTIGFWFGTGVILAAKMIHNLEDCIKSREENGRRKSSDYKERSSNGKEPEES